MRLYLVEEKLKNNNKFKFETKTVIKFVNKYINGVCVYLQFLMSDMKTARPRIPSPRTGAIITSRYVSFASVY